MSAEQEDDIILLDDDEVPLEPIDKVSRSPRSQREAHPRVRRCLRSPATIGLIVVLAAISIAAIVVAATDSPKLQPIPSPSDEISNRVLLPKNVKPLKYRIHLTPNFKDFSFHGVEEVDIEVLQPSDTIVFHALELDLNEITFSRQDIILDSFSCSDSSETCTVRLQRKLVAGDKFTMIIDFDGVLNDLMHGFYRSKYIHEGQEKWIATTQFEPVDARRAFPCWDEPAIKAKFQVTLTIPSHMIALNNMPVEHETIDAKSETRTVRFQETPLMSTYLVAFIVGEFDYVEGVTQGNALMRVYTPVGKSSMAQFALDVGKQVLDYFSEFFDIPFPLPKMDMIAIPDFAAGAMENWGLITYRDTALLVDSNASVSAKWRVADVVAHELAHQWFGNIVTMEWWTDLWLNEGFATYIGTQAVSVFFPEWDVWTQFMTEDLFRALELDALLSSHPIEVAINSSREIDAIFDAISYSKGASVIRQLKHFVGADDFRRGLQLYLKRNMWGNAKTKDLWDAIGEVSGKPVAKVMETWTKKVGFPIILPVSMKVEGEMCLLTLKQQRFLASGEPSAEVDNTVWPFVIPYQTPTQNSSVFMQEKTQTFGLPVDACTKWVKLNSGHTSIVRTFYDDNSLTKFAANLDKLGSTDRLGLQNDAFATSMAGYTPVSSVLKLVAAYRNETEYAVWRDLVTNLNVILRTWESNNRVTEALHKLLRYLFVPIYDKLGWIQQPTHSDLDKLLRSVVLDKLGEAGYNEVIEVAKTRFQEFLMDRDSLPRDLRRVVFKLVMRNGGEQEYNTMVALFNEAIEPEDKTAALWAIGLSKQPELIRRALDFAISGKVRPQDVYILISSCASTPIGRNLSFAFLQEKWVSYFSVVQKGSLLVRIVSDICSGFDDESSYYKVERFLRDHTTDDTQRPFEQILEALQQSIRWKIRTEEDVKRWAEEYLQSNAQVVS